MKYPRRQPSSDEMPFGCLPAEWLDQTAEWLKETERYFESGFGLDLYLIYGTLRGAVGEGDFAPGARGVEVAVMSRHHLGAAVAAEYRAMVEKLRRDRRLVAEPSPGLLRVRPHPGKPGPRAPEGMNELEVHVSWSAKERLFLHPRLTGELPAEAVVPLRRGRLRRQDFWFPRESEVLLEELYGASWRSAEMEVDLEPESSDREAFQFLR